jgi:FixJ family two-component response regulator
MQEPTVYLVDDDADLRDSLRWLMETVGLRVRAFGSAAEFLGAERSEGPGCLVLDVRMPGKSGLDLFEELVARGEGMPAIFVTAFADVPMAVRAIKSGAVEFVEKPFNRQALLDKVQRAIEEDARRRDLLAHREALDARFRSLTAKEREVLELIAEGLPNKAIANRLEITTRAVEMRRASLMRKLAARSLADLLRLAYLRNGNGNGNGS